MNVLLMAICLAVAVFAAIALIIFMAVGERSPAELRLAELSSGRLMTDDETEVSASFDVQDIFSVMTRPLAPFRDWLRSRDDELSYWLGIAGFRKPEDADTFLKANRLAPVVGVLIATFFGSSNFIFMGLLFGVVGFFVPDVFLFWEDGQRKLKINRALPDTLDLLVVCMEAGLGIDQATMRIAKEIESVYPELSEELLIIGYEQRAGKPRLEAWRSMSDRVDLDTVRQYVAMLVQTERLYDRSIAQSLSQFADSLRTKRLLLAEEQAAKTTVKLIFPLAFSCSSFRPCLS